MKHGFIYKNIEDRNLEMSILGAMVQFPDATKYAQTHLSECDFAVELHRVIYKTTISYLEKTGVVDFVAICSEIMTSPTLNKAVPDGEDVNVYIMTCVSLTSTSVTMPDKCMQLKEIASRREAWRLGSGIASYAQDGYHTGSEIWRRVEDAIKKRAERSGNEAQTLPQVLGSLIKETPHQPIKTGFRYIDSKGGFSEGDLVIIAAETSQGKTSLALDICMNFARNGYPVMFYSAEMRAEQLAARMLSMTSNVNSNSILRNDLTDEQIVATDKGIAQLEKLPICFDDKASIDIDTIIDSIRRAVKQFNAKIIFIDYLQVLQFNERLLKQTEESFFGSVARRLKNIAKELNVCVVLLSQLSRGESREPSLSRLRGSGQIAEAADIVMTIYRPEEYGKTYSGSFANIDTHGTALIKIEKGRNIGTGAFICGFDAKRTHFYDLEQPPIRKTIAGYRPFETHNETI